MKTPLKLLGINDLSIRSGLQGIAMKASTSYLGVWLAAAMIAALLALQFDTAAYVDGQYIPVGNDSFYHARRILDAAVGQRGFYEFDAMIHVPEGSWLNWPWAYDRIMAFALTLALWFRPSTEPMAFLAHIPVVWTFVNIGLVTMICRRIRLSPIMSAPAIFGMASLPLTQTLHGVGVVDHHFIEWTFVLATLWAGLGTFSSARITDAVLLGVILGMAPAFHNGLFVLQIPVLATSLALWMRGAAPEARCLYWLAGALTLTTLLALLPSAAFRDMQFEFWTLSWFHLYLAASSGIVLAFLGPRTCTKANLTWFVVTVMVLVLPLVAKLIVGAEFLTGKMVLLDQITEVKSPFSRMTEPGGLRWVTSYYSWLILLAPLLLIGFAVRAWWSSESPVVFFSIFAVFGILMMLAQYRFHQFGSWTLLIGSMVLVEQLRVRRAIPVLAMSAASLLVLAMAFTPPLKNLLFYAHPPGLSADYAATRSLFPSLAAACAEEAGAVLAYTDDGHYIRYHSECSVITNNFLLTPLHRRKIMEADRYLQMTPDQLLQAVPQVKYVFVRMYEIFESGPNGIRPRPIANVGARNAPLFVALTFGRDLPDNYKLIDEVRVQDYRDFAYARVYRILRDK